jgi:tetrahydromethanopterin S-methyltransferase subunit B
LNRREDSGTPVDDQQRRVGLTMITSMKTEFFFGFLIGFVTGVLLCVGVLFLIEPSHF